MRAITASRWSGPAAPPCDRCVMTLVDQTSQRHTERSLRREMTTDSLTGLPNREGFGTVIEDVHGDRARHALLVVDLARFGRLNACLGSLVGDELLITVARRIKGALRACDLLARIGGDEFGILMAIDEERSEAHHLAGRIQRALSAPFRLTDYEIGVECSIGIAFGADEGEDAEEMIRHAQFAVKRAKESGHSESYQPDAFVIARRQFGMETVAAPRDREPRASPDLSADLRSRDRRDRIVRGAGALDHRRGGGRSRPVRFHPRRGGIGADRPARPLGDRRGRPDAGRVGRRGRRPLRRQAGGQPVRDPVATRRDRPRRRTRAGQARAGRRTLHAGTDRKRDRPPTPTGSRARWRR